MHFIIGIILVSVFLGFILSPKGSDAQTIIRRGFLSLLALLAIAAVVGGIWYWIDKTQTERREKELASQQDFTPATTYVEPQLPQIDLSGKWHSETESITDFTIVQDGSKITMSKFNFDAQQSGKPNYTVSGQIEGNSVIFNNSTLSGKLTLKAGSYHRELVGTVKEKGREVVFVLEER